MFSTPTDIKTEVFLTMQPPLRRTASPSPWVKTIRHGAPTGCFLEGPSFDHQGSLLFVDVAYSVFRIIALRGSVAHAEELAIR